VLSNRRRVKDCEQTQPLERAPEASGAQPLHPPSSSDRTVSLERLQGEAFRRIESLPTSTATSRCSRDRGRS